MKSIKRLRKTQPVMKKKVIELEVGGWLGRWFTNRGWGGVTIPFPFLVLICYWTEEPSPDGELNPLIRVHEFVHVAQDQENLFFAVSWAKYLWESVRRLSWKSIREHGLGHAFLEAYYANGYEAEAYAIEDMAEKNGLPIWAN